MKSAMNEIIDAEFEVIEGPRPKVSMADEDWAFAGWIGAFVAFWFLTPMLLSALR